MAVGLAVLRELLDKDLVMHTMKMGNLIMEKLTGLSDRYEIKNIRGMGLLIAFDLTKTKGADFVAECMKDKLLINSPKEMSIRLMPPLVVTEEEIEKVISVFKNNLAERQTA
jgi:acetylornithine/N-succinyldiaminopimelate aminotransferase